jgi:hypothetical protein
MDFEGFLFVVENLCSDIFIYLLIFLFEKRPFSKLSLKRYGSLSFNRQGSFFTPEVIPTKKIISPNLHSKFSPSITLTKSPYIRQKFGMQKIQNVDSKNLLLKYTNKQNETGPLTSPVKFREYQGYMNSPIKFAINKKKSMTALKISQIIESDVNISSKKSRSKEFTSAKLKSISNEEKE